MGTECLQITTVDGNDFSIGAAAAGPLFRQAVIAAPEGFAAAFENGLQNGLVCYTAEAAIQITAAVRQAATCGCQHPKVIKIAQKMSSGALALNHRESAAAVASAPDPGINSSKLLAATLPTPPAAAGLDIERGVVSLMTQRGRATTTHPGLTEAARRGHMTLARAATLHTRRAESAEEIEAAHQLVHRRYAWRGYDVPTPGEPHSRPRSDAAGREITFVATDEIDTVGTITLGLDSSEGLLAERTHGNAVAQRRAAGGSVCELTRLAVAERADSKSVLAALFNLAYVAGSVHGVTDVFIEVNPRHVWFYTRVLGFAVAAAEKFCERVHAPSILLSLALEELERRLLDINMALAPLPAARAA